jgi:hypothetical protein
MGRAEKEEKGGGGKRRGERKRFSVKRFPSAEQREIYLHSATNEATVVSSVKVRI